MNNQPVLSQIVEALLFAAGEPLAISKLADLTEQSPAHVVSALSSLEQTLQQRGVSLLRKDETAVLVTAPHLSSYIEKLIKEEVLGDLSKAALETLTVIAYQHPISRPDIDYIRGVNSSFTLRNLMARGLIERALSKQRSYQYQPTLEFMKYIGIASFSDLPEYENVRKEFSKGIELQPSKESY